MKPGKYLLNGKPIELRTAEGVSGFIMCSSGEVFFCVYDAEDKNKFTGYAIAHSDLEVMIADGAGAAFYIRPDGKAIVDHDPETLGLKLEPAK